MITTTLWRSGILATALLTACMAQFESSDSENNPTSISMVTETRLSRIAFGSCAVQLLPQTFWQQIAADKPDLFIFGGDNIYGDLKIVDGQPRVGEGNPELLASNYALLAANPDFSAFRDQFRILPVWDDHDYGENDGGASYKYKEDSERQFLDFWKVPESDPRRTYPGIYFSEVYGLKGETVQIILLDTRYFRSDLLEASQQSARVDSPPDASGFVGKYVPDPDPGKTLLGEDQWRWLKAQLKKTADIRLIVSSIQVVADGHGWERWGNLPLQRQRLYKLITDENANGVIFLSGDRHRAALYELKSNEVPYPILELTSSSLNRPFPGGDEMGPHQLGKMYEEANYSTVDIDWNNRTVELSIRNMAGESVRTKTVTIDSLKANQS